MSVILFNMELFLVMVTAGAGQSWPFPQQPILTGGFQPPQFGVGGTGGGGGFFPMDTNSIQQQQFQSGMPYRPYYPSPGLAQQTAPRMQMALVQLLCEAPPGQSPTAIRWVRQGSSAMTSAPITIAEGQNSADPLRYAVTLEASPTGTARSVLTVLSPDPDANQAAFYCQTISTAGQAAQSREVYVIGNRQFVNANMAYHAADTVSAYGPRTASVEAAPGQVIPAELTTVQGDQVPT